MYLKALSLRGSRSLSFKCRLPVKGRKLKEGLELGGLRLGLGLGLGLGLEVVGIGIGKGLRSGYILR
jgi:hypothetical protein